MFCKNCGTENLDLAKFCKKCGEKFLQGQAFQDETRPVITQGKSNNLLIGVVIVIVLLLGGAVLAGKSFFASKNPDVSQQPATTQNNKKNQALPPAIVPGVVIGQSYGGGVLAYVLQPKDHGYDANIPHGLIAATTDISTTYKNAWGGKDLTGEYAWSTGQYAIVNDTDYEWRLIGNTNTIIGSGSDNTTKILTKYSAETYPNTAAAMTRKYKSGGYSDWFLPSRDELLELYNNKEAIGGFTDESYWSSSEKSDNDIYRDAFDIDFEDGSLNQATKAYPLRVRAVRIF